MKSYQSREIIEILEKEGWYLHRIKGSHHQYKHKVKKGTVPVHHPKKDLPIGTVKSILKLAGVEI